MFAQPTIQHMAVEAVPSATRTWGHPLENSTYPLRKCEPKGNSSVYISMDMHSQRDRSASVRAYPNAAGSARLPVVLLPALAALAIGLPAAHASTHPFVSPEQQNQGISLGSGPAFADSGRRAPDPLWIEATAQPTVHVQWRAANGTSKSHTRSLPYTEAVDRVLVGDNLQMYVSVGGTRLEVGAGHPRGVVVRLGLYKADEALPFFGSVDPDHPIEIELRGVRFKSSAVPIPESILQHLIFALNDVVACGLSEEFVNMYNLASEDDTLNGRVDETRGRFGALNIDPRETTTRLSQTGTAAVVVEADGSVTLKASFPYRMLRHQADPSSLDLPGTFFEPTVLQLEFEAVSPVDAERDFGVLMEDVARPALLGVHAPANRVHGSH